MLWFNYLIINITYLVFLISGYDENITESNDLNDSENINVAGMFVILMNFINIFLRVIASYDYG